MNILFATLNTYELDKKNYTCYQARDEEHVFKLIEKKKPDYIVVEKEYVKNMKWKEYMLKLSVRYPLVKMIVLLLKESMTDRDFLYKWNIFDILITSNITKKEIEEQIKNPLSFRDINVFYGRKNSLNVSKKAIEKYAFFEENPYYITHEDQGYAIEYSFSNEKNDNDYACSILIPYGNEAWKYEIEIYQIDTIPKSVEEMIQKAKEIFKIENRLKKMLNE